MKKLALLIAVLLVATPALATVTISFEDEGGGVVGLYYSSDEGTPRAFGLDISVDGADIVSVDTTGAQPFPFYPGSAVFSADGSEIEDQGSPVAPEGDVGAAGPLGSNSITIEMGSLYGEGSEPPATVEGPDDSGLLLLLTLEGTGSTATISAEANPERAGNGVVMEDAEQADEVVFESADITLGEEECFDSAHEDYDEWVAVGKPESWCYTYQCYGDADGQENGNVVVGFSRVREQDLSILLDGWKDEEYVDPETDPWIAADFDRTENGNVVVGFSRIREQDLAILLDNWKDDSGIPGLGASGEPNCGGNL